MSENDQGEEHEATAPAPIANPAARTQRRRYQWCGDRNTRAKSGINRSRPDRRRPQSKAQADDERIHAATATDETDATEGSDRLRHAAGTARARGHERAESPPRRPTDW
jgi:hypothetical protein